MICHFFGDYHEIYYVEEMFPQTLWPYPALFLVRFRIRIIRDGFWVSCWLHLFLFICLNPRQCWELWLSPVWKPWTNLLRGGNVSPKPYGPRSRDISVTAILTCLYVFSMSLDAVLVSSLEVIGERWRFYAISTWQLNRNPLDNPSRDLKCKC